MIELLGTDRFDPRTPDGFRMIILKKGNSINYLVSILLDN